MIYEVTCPICGKVNKLNVDATKLSIYEARLGQDN